MELPDAGSVLKWVATVTLPRIEGQGIAWDRYASSPKGTGILWGILRPETLLVKFEVPLQEGAVKSNTTWYTVHDDPADFALPE